MNTNRLYVVIEVITAGSTSMISMHARPTWVMFNTRMRRCARSFKSISAKWTSRSRSVRSRQRELNSLNSQATFITWSRPRLFQAFTTHHLSMLSLRLSTSKLNSTSSLHSRWTISGSPLTRRRLSFSVLCPWSSKKRWSIEKYSIKKLSISDVDHYDLWS